MNYATHIRKNIAMDELIKGNAKVHDPVIDWIKRNAKVRECIITSATKSLVDWLLSINTNNRSVREKALEAYVREIQSGKWHFTSQGIGISSEMILLDGQHRLFALAKSNYPAVDLLIATGISPEAAIAIDQHSKRNTRDAIKFAFGQRVTAKAPAIATCIIAKTLTGLQASRNTVSEIYDVITEYNDQIEFCCDAPKSAETFSAGDLAGFVLTYTESNKNKLREFMIAVENGEMLSGDNPAFHLRNSIIKCRSKGSSGMVFRLERLDKAAKCAEAYIEGRSMKLLRL